MVLCVCVCVSTLFVLHVYVVVDQAMHTGMHSNCAEDFMIIMVMITSQDFLCNAICLFLVPNYLCLTFHFVETVVSTVLICCLLCSRCVKLADVLKPAKAAADDMLSMLTGSRRWV